MTSLDLPHRGGRELTGRQHRGWNLTLDAPERVDALMLINVIGYPEKTLPAGLRLARNPLLRRCLPRSATERGLREAVGASRRTITAIV